MLIPNKSHLTNIAASYNAGLPAPAKLEIIMKGCGSTVALL
jgi:hypothetical protein